MKQVFAKHLPYEDGHLGEVASDMDVHGAPTIRVVRVGCNFYALEGSHRLAVAHHRGEIPKLVVEMEEQDTLPSEHWQRVAETLPLYQFAHVMVLELAQFKRERKMSDYTYNTLSSMIVEPETNMWATIYVSSKEDYDRLAVGEILLRHVQKHAGEDFCPLVPMICTTPLEDDDVEVFERRITELLPEVKTFIDDSKARGEKTITAIFVHPYDKTLLDIH